MLRLCFHIHVRVLYANRGRGGGVAACQTTTAVVPTTTVVRFDAPPKEDMKTTAAAAFGACLDHNLATRRLHGYTIEYN